MLNPPDGKLQMPRDDPRLLVVPGGVASQLQDLGSQVLHDRGHVDWCTSTNPLSVVAFPRDQAFRLHRISKQIHINLRSLWIRPTGNCSPARLERDLALPFTLPPLPRPDIVMGYSYLKNPIISSMRPGDGRKEVGQLQLRSYLELVYLVTALVPSDTACLASSPGRSRRTAVWISREVIVDLHKIIKTVNF